MELTLEELVWKRAGACCEYCHMPQRFDDALLEIDHIIAASHGGLTRASNLCLACFSCSLRKWAKQTAVDPKTRKIVPLFHPRRHKWARHFFWDGPRLAGRTPTGRATVVTLRINLDHRVAHRHELIDEGVFPPD